MKFNQIAISKLKKEDYLWRYIDLHKLLDLIIKKQLYFSRLDQFNDPFDGITMNLIEKRYFAKMSNINNPNIPSDLVKKMKWQQNKTLEDCEIESQIRRKTQYVNCWIKSERESIAMWSLYSNKESVALKANGIQLVNYFEYLINLQPTLYKECDFVCGSVFYFKLNPLDPFEKRTLPKFSAFKKDVAFDYEKEYRFLIAIPKESISDEISFKYFPITKTFFTITEIVCHPEMPDWKFKNIEDICSKYELSNPRKSEI